MLNKIIQAILLILFSLFGKGKEKRIDISLSEGKEIKEEVWNLKEQQEKIPFRNQKGRMAYVDPIFREKVKMSQWAHKHNTI